MKRPLIRVAITAAVILLIALIVRIAYNMQGLPVPDDISTYLIIAFVFLPVVVFLFHAPGMAD